MKVHLRQIPKGDTLHLEGEEDPSALELEEAGAVPVGPLRYSLDVGLSEGGLFVTGQIGQRVRMTCVSCLESFEREMGSDLFATQLELSGSELVDLTSEVREDIHLLLPAHPRCDQGGEKSCPASYPAAARRPSAQAESSLEEISRLEKSAQATWAALDKLNTLPDPSNGSP